MKSIKKLLLTMAMIMAFGTSAFAKSGFEFLINLPLSMNFGIPKDNRKVYLFSEISFSSTGGGSSQTKKQTNESTPVSIGFDVGVEAQIGYMFQAKDNFAISVLGEFGYSYDLYGFDYEGWEYAFGGIVNYKLNCKQFYHNVKVGLFPKFNIGLKNKQTIAIGIGGGVKIPLSGKFTMKANGSYSGYMGDGTIEGTRDVDITRKDITDTFAPSLIGYVKATCDYYLFFNENIAMNFGVYLAGDIGPIIKDLGIISDITGFEISVNNLKEAKLGANAIEIGIQLGFRYGPKA